MPCPIINVSGRFDTSPSGDIHSNSARTPKREAMSQQRLHVVLAKPRGFCAGVRRAIDIVERALERENAPVFVRHEIVHNRHVVDRLSRQRRDIRPGTVRGARRRGDDLQRARRAPFGRGRGARARTASDRRHLPACRQGAFPGAALCQSRTHRGADRPCRPSRSCRNTGSGRCERPPRFDRGGRRGAAHCPKTRRSPT